MTARLTLATAGRVLRQIRHDHRTLALMLVVPCVLLGLLAWIYNNTPLFDLIGAPLLGLFPFLVMFLVTSIATLRERQSGTLERLLALPVGKGDFVGGYAVAFGLLAAIQAVIASTFAIYVLDLDVAGSQALLVLVAVVDALLGTALGLFLSAFAATEFQAIQFFPAFILPQFLLCGLLVPRDQLPDVLRWVSNVLPLSYAVDAMHSITVDPDGRADVLRSVLIVLGFVGLLIAVGANTLRRRTALSEEAGRRAHKATAAAAATLSESTPPAMGMRTVRSAAARVCRASPSPSVPSTRASRSGGSAARRSSDTEPSLSARAATVKPSSRSMSTPPGQGSIRVHGTWKTVPIETRIALRYSGSAHRGVTSTASTPSAAALRMAAPTFVWSTMSSRTSTRRASASRSAGAQSAGRCIAASAPRCR